MPEDVERLEDCPDCALFSGGVCAGGVVDDSGVAEDEELWLLLLFSGVSAELLESFFSLELSTDVEDSADDSVVEVSVDSDEEDTGVELSGTSVTDEDGTVVEGIVVLGVFLSWSVKYNSPPDLTSPLGICQSLFVTLDDTYFINSR